MEEHTYAKNIFEALFFPSIFPIIISYLSLPLERYVRSNAWRATFWWPFITGTDENGKLII